MLAGGGPIATGWKTSSDSQPSVNLQASVDVGIIEARVPVATTVDAVPVTVWFASIVVSLNTVAVVSMTVGCADDVTMTVPSLVKVVGATVIEDMLTTVGTGMLATVSLDTTVSNVDTGMVTVAVMDSGGADVVPLSGTAVALAGCRVDSVMLGRLVGNGCTGGLPSVARVVMIEPVMFAPLSMLVSVGDCVLGIEVSVTV